MRRAFAHPGYRNHLRHLGHALKLSSLLLGSLILVACSAPESGEATPPRPAIVVHPKASGSQLAVYPGEVHARHESVLAFRVGGAVTRRLVETGQRVKQGQPLAELDAQDLNLQRDAAKAQLQAAQTENRNASNELARYRDLLERKLIGESQFDAVSTRHDSSVAQLERARAQLQVAANQAAYAVLKAPSDGVITRRSVDAGQVVSAGQTVFVLAADGEREVRIDLPEHEVTRFAVGQPVSIELWSAPGAPISGTVRELSPAAEAGLRTFEARVTLVPVADSAANQPAPKLGQSARVYARTSSARPTQRLPMSAITAEGAAPYVWRMDPEHFTLHKVAVTIANYGHEDAEVISTLSLQDWILAAGTQLVREGQRVRPVDRQNRPIEADNRIAHQQ
ncbi:efflux RND transporter periplasmic adaptor subunit [Microbulbifer agarilyticus]|uniref:efflux RND transporter periplasmic adaptor subunit n=1 Tax=Microbulbifer agarilyticus TaxID=260552 RepID=UPI001CD21602|nr:efflux RND transporter periplasmic adaptor subunit [Microbulbifer agarilyticus]MCA0892887.1 efflux RND transporter periplasmic adaptor subunit [Microbulbifer agarilyticus]